jgi:hypothetical protein
MKRFVRELIPVAGDALYKAKEQEKNGLVIESQLYNEIFPNIF